jgi:hypothetical protein
MGLHHYAGRLFAAGIFAVVSAAYAEEDHRELGSHVHGRATLAIAVEANNVQMEFAAPGMDIVGFEHEAETARQKRAVETALADLREPLELFVFPETAGCTLTSAKVNVIAEDDKHHDAEAETDDTAETEELEDRHAEFRATYALACADAAQLTSIYFPFFSRFADAHALAVTIIDADGQSSSDVTSDYRHLER